MIVISQFAIVYILQMNAWKVSSMKNLSASGAGRIVPLSLSLSPLPPPSPPSPWLGSYLAAELVLVALDLSHLARVSLEAFLALLQVFLWGKLDCLVLPLISLIS